MSSNMTVVKVAIHKTLEDRGDYWAARLEGLAVTAYGDSQEAAAAASDKMLDFIVKTFKDNYSLDDFRGYLDRHRVSHSVSYVGDEKEQLVDREVVFA